MALAEKQQSRVLQVPCIRCNALQSQRCTQPGRDIPLVGGFHKERVQLADKLIPNLPDELDSTDKALITYYAFIALADACSAKSVELFGKHFDSAEIQRTFARNAVAELKTAGLLK